MKVKAIRYDLENQPGLITFEFSDIKSEVWEITENFQ